MDVLLEGTKLLTLLAAFAMGAVLAAMSVDLAAGIMKAKQRGEARRSYGLKRTLSKFVLYEGGMLIAYLMDLLVHWAHLWRLVGAETLSGVPAVSFLVAGFLLVMEWMSIWEKADEKMHGDAVRAQKAAEAVAERLSGALLDALAERVAAKVRGAEADGGCEPPQ